MFSVATVSAHSRKSASRAKANCIVVLTSIGKCQLLSVHHRACCIYALAQKLLFSFSRLIQDRLAYSTEHFSSHRRFGTKCSGCNEGISPSDMVRRAKNLVFHVGCFICSYCKRQIATGDELYYIGDGKFICKEDYYQSYLPGKSHSGKAIANWFVY